jgi:hypothetical protein
METYPEPHLNRCQDRPSCRAETQADGGGADFGGTVPHSGHRSAMTRRIGDTIQASLIPRPTAFLGLESPAVDPCVAGSPDTPPKPSARPGRSTADAASILPDSPMRCYHHFPAERHKAGKTARRSGREKFSPGKNFLLPSGSSLVNVRDVGNEQWTMSRERPLSIMHYPLRPPPTPLGCIRLHLGRTAPERRSLRWWRGERRP